MKVRFAVSASVPSNLGGVYASLYYVDHRFGRTEVINGCTNPSWKKMFVLDSNNVDGADITVSISSGNDNGEIGRVQFNVAAILEHKNGVLQKDLTSGGTVFVHASEHIIDQTTFSFQIHGKDLVNVSRGKALGLKTNPFYELRRASDNLVVHTSEVREKNLDPDWSTAEICLRRLCDGDFDAPIAFDFFHKDAIKKRKCMGSFETTVNDLLIAAAQGISMTMVKDGESMGQVLVLKAECVGFTDSSAVLSAAKETKELMDATSLVASSKSQAADLVKEEFEKARQEAEARMKNELEAKMELAEAEKAAEKAETVSLQAAEVAKQMKEAGLTGTLKFQLVGKKLKNVETFGFMNLDKSDPFFVLQKVASEKDGQINWSHVYMSEHVLDDLEPTWKECAVEVTELCTNGFDEPIRIVVFDWEESGKHQLIGFYVTTINGIVSAQRSKAEIPLTDVGGGVTGFILVSYAEVVGYVDPKPSEERAKELKDKAENARFFAKGAVQKVKSAGESAEAAQNTAIQIKQTFDAATEEANAARRRAMEETVTQRLGELGLAA